jgi:hypothetical protein
VFVHIFMDFGCAEFDTVCDFHRACTAWFHYVQWWSTRVVKPCANVKFGRSKIGESRSKRGMEVKKRFDMCCASECQHQGRDWLSGCLFWLSEAMMLLVVFFGVVS